MYTIFYFLFFYKTRTLKSVTKLLQGTIKLEKNHFRKLCHLNSKNTRVKILSLIIFPRSCQAETNLNIEDSTCQVPAWYSSFHGRILKLK